MLLTCAGEFRNLWVRPSGFLTTTLLKGCVAVIHCTVVYMHSQIRSLYVSGNISAKETSLVGDKDGNPCFVSEVAHHTDVIPLDAVRKRCSHESTYG